MDLDRSKIFFTDLLLIRRSASGGILCYHRF